MFNIPDPVLQVRIASLLEDMRGRHLRQALLATVATIDVALIDEALDQLIPKESLSMLAS